MEHHHVPRARNPFFYKNGPWVHITVEYATSTANFCPLSLSNSPLQACMTRQHISAPFFEVSRLKAITFKTAFPFLDGNCRRQNVIYQATVTTGTTIESYIGLSSHWLQRTVRKSLDILPTREQKKRELELSKQVWTLKDANRSFHVQGKVLSNCKPYDKANKNCNLCLQEKIFIICKKHLCTLNKRNELASSCPYRNRFTLGNFRIT